MISKSYGKKRAAFQKQRSGRRQDWQEAGLDEGFSWINSLWRGDTSRVASKHCRAELRANTRRKPISPLNMSLLILYFTLFFHPLLCISVPFFSPASFSPSFFSCTAPPNIWLLAFYLSIAPRLPHSRLLPKSFFRSLLLLIIFHSATPLSLCLSFFFIYFVLKATGCTLVVH